MIPTQFIKMYNSILKEYIVQARIVGTQTVDFNDWCMRMANGSTVMAADVDRELHTSDLAITDCTVCIEIVLPKFWDEALKKRAILKRVKTTAADVTEAEDTEETPSSGSQGSTESGTTESGNQGSTEGGGDNSGGAGFENG